MKKVLLLSILLISFMGIQAQDVVPAKDGDLYSLTTGDIYFEVDADFGGQVSSYQVGGSELLFFGDGGNVGSTLWYSPQNSWPAGNWPPSTELDSDAYTAEISDNKIVMEGEMDPDSKLSFKKTYSADSETSTVTLDYLITNEGSSARSFAAWEVTRVPTPGGITFFPKGDGSVTGGFASYTEELDGIVWYDQDDSDPGNNKFFCDGSEGWLAHVNKDGYLFVKTFDDVAFSEMAPGEAEVEFWHAAPTTYVELENQSAHESVPADGSLIYTVIWYAEELPAEIDVSPGSTELVAYVRSWVKPTAVKKDAIDNLIKVYPNPASDYIRIASNPSETSSLKIYDITAKLVLQRIDVSASEQVDISSLHEGIYFYSISQGQTLKSGKLIIK